MVAKGEYLKCQRDGFIDYVMAVNKCLHMVSRNHESHVVAHDEG